MKRSSPHHDGPRQRTLGVVVHTTRSGVARHPDVEAVLTWDWLCGPEAERVPQDRVSAHVVVGETLTLPVLPDELVAWHARGLNATHLGIELAQPTPTSPISDDALRLAAAVVRRWSQRYGFPLAHATRDDEPGLIGHDETGPGRAEGKTDPGPWFDWPRFLALCQETTVEERVLDHLAVVWGYGEVAAALVRDLAGIHPRIAAVERRLTEIDLAVRERAAAIRRDLELP